MRIVDWIEGATRVAPISHSTRKTLHDHLMGAGELLRSNALEPTPLFDEQLAQDKLSRTGMIIQPIVEGQGDEAAVPLLLLRLRDDFINSLT